MSSSSGSLRRRPKGLKSIGTTGIAGADSDLSKRQNMWRPAMQVKEQGEWKEAMRPINYEIIFDVEDDHWWFVGRRAIVFAMIEQALGSAAGSRHTSCVPVVRSRSTAMREDLSSPPARR